MGIDWEALRGAAADTPPNGVHRAYLDRASVVDTSNGEKLVTEWKTSGADGPLYAWTTWFGLAGQALGFTQTFLDSIGVDRSQITDYASFDIALDRAVGIEYEVETKRWGDRGDGVNVTVLGGAKERQQQLVDAPTEPVTVPSTDADDDDIPF
jgi:hypothetical protein